MSDDKGSDDIESKAERKRNLDKPSGVLPQKLKSLTGGNVCNSLADLLKITRLRGVGADDAKEFREIVLHLFTNNVKPAHSKRDSQQARIHVNYLLFNLVDEMHLIWDANHFLDRVQELVKRQSTSMQFTILQSLTGSRPVKKGAVRRSRLGEQVAVNMHTMGTSFVVKVRDVWQIAKAQIEEGRGGRHGGVQGSDVLLSGNKLTKKASRIQAWQHLSDWQLANRF